MSKKKNNTHLEATKKNPSQQHPTNPASGNPVSGESKTQAEVIKKSLNDMVNAIDKEKDLPEKDQSTSKVELKNTDNPSHVSKETSNQSEDLKKTSEKENSPKKVETLESDKKIHSHHSSSSEVGNKETKGSGLALLLGLAGVGLGGYCYYQLNYEKSMVNSQPSEHVIEVKRRLDEVINNQPNYKQLEQQLVAFDHKLTQKESTDTNKQLVEQITELSSQQNQLIEDKAKIENQLKTIVTQNEARQNQAENPNNVALSADGNQSLEKTLNEQAQLIANLQQKVTQLNQTMEGLGIGQTDGSGATKGVDVFASAAAKATQKVSDELAKKEVSYLVNMAVNKIGIEKNLGAAKQLLEQIQQKTKGNALFSGEFTQSINQHLAAIHQIKPIDTQWLENKLASISELSEKLKTKNQSIEKVSVTEEKEGVLNQIKSIALSGIKFTPKDPSKVDISAETSLIEKRLIKADIEQAKFALKTQNQSDWKQLLDSVNQRLITNFEEDAVFEEITNNIQQLQSGSIVVEMPVLDSLKTLLK